MGDVGLLVFARCAGFVFRAPGFSHPSVPPPLRAGLAYVLSLALMRGSTSHVAAPAALPFAVASEALIGAAIGIAASMLYDGAFAGGRAIDDYVGIKSSVPSANVSAGAGFGRLWSLAFTAGFFVLGGYRFALVGFAQTLQTLPPGTLASARDIATFAIALPQTLVRAAFFVAGPAIALALVAQVGLALLSRLAPRFSTFTLTFPVVFASVLLATIAALPIVLGAAGRPWMDLAAVRAR